MNVIAQIIEITLLSLLLTSAFCDNPDEEKTTGTSDYRTFAIRLDPLQTAFRSFFLDALTVGGNMEYAAIPNIGVQLDFMYARICNMDGVLARRLFSFKDSRGCGELLSATYSRETCRSRLS